MRTLFVICLINQSGIWIISQLYTCDLKRRQPLGQRKNWSPMFGQISNILFQVRDDVLFYQRSNCDDSIGELIRPLFTWMDLNEISNMIKECRLNRNYEFILTLIRLSHQQILHMETMQNIFHYGSKFDDNRTWCSHWQKHCLDWYDKAEIWKD